MKCETKPQRMTSLVSLLISWGVHSANTKNQHKTKELRRIFHLVRRDEKPQLSQQCDVVDSCFNWPFSSHSKRLVMVCLVLFLLCEPYRVCLGFVPVVFRR